MKTIALRLVATAGLTAAVAVTVVPAASAQPSCVAQSTLAEHATNGPGWGHDVIAYLATHPQYLQQFGFADFGELAAFAARQDRTACPADL